MVLFIGGILIATFCSTSCSKKCTCQDNNSGYIYPDYDLKKEGHRNCRKLQKALNAEGKSVSCMIWF